MKNYDHLVGNDVTVRITEKLYRTGTIVRWNNTPNGPVVTVNLKETYEPLKLNDNTVVSAVTTILENVAVIANLDNPL